MKYQLPKWAKNLFPIRAAYERGFNEFGDPTMYNPFLINSDQYKEYERGWNAGYTKQKQLTQNIEKSKAKKHADRFGSA